MTLLPIFTSWGNCWKEDASSTLGMHAWNKVKSVVEFQGEKYINSKIILFCGVIEFLINHFLIPNKTSHNLFIWNWRCLMVIFECFRSYSTASIGLTRAETQIVKEKVLLLLLQKSGGAGGKLLPPWALYYWLPFSKLSGLRREFPWDYWFQSWWVSSTLSSN